MPVSPPRAVLDPNVLVSAAITDRGIPAELILRSERGEFELVTSAEILMELLEVLRRPKFRRYLTEDEAVDFTIRIHDGSADVSEELPKDIVTGVTADPDDDYLGGVAFRGEAGIIVSGDRHLLDLPDRRIVYGVDNTFVRILAPREFVDELQRQG